MKKEKRMPMAKMKHSEKKGHMDVKEDKKLIKKMVKKGCMK